MPTVMMTRTHILLPTDLLNVVDELVGPRHRSELITRLVNDWVHRQRQIEALQAIATSPAPEGDPAEWDEPGGVDRWVRALRDEESSRESRIELLRAETSK